MEGRLTGERLRPTDQPSHGAELAVLRIGDDLPRDLRIDRRHRLMLASMATRGSRTYQSTGLTAAVVDLIRVGSTGHGAGVRQLAARLLRDVPREVADAEGFRRAVHEAMSVRPSAGLRFAGGAIPTDTEGTHPLADVEPLPDGEGLALEPDAQTELDEVVAERRHATELARAGAGMTRTVLLSGPPGVGKTLAARWLAQSVGLPLVTLDLASVVSSYLGTSGRNIRSVLDYAKTGECVLLLDEFDALAKRRDDDADIGELKRIVNVILVELDRWPDTSLLVAATNHPQLLDPAVGRRFDRIVELGLPGREVRRAILDHLAHGASTSEPAVLDLVADVTNGSTGSDLTRLWSGALRRAVLHDTTVEEELLTQVMRSQPEASSERDELWAAVHLRLGWSHRRIAERAGVSHPTIGAAIRRVEARA